VSQVPAATRTLRVLRFLATQADPVPLDRIVRACDLPRSTAYHLLTAMTEEGFVALAPDLYHGKSTKSPDEAGKLMMAMRIDEAERDLSAAVEYLTTQDSTTSEKIGVVGFCMGGALSLYTATKNEKIGACVVFYGGHPKVRPDLPNLQAPVLGLYGEKDKGITPETVHKLERDVKALGKSIEVVIYPGADHAFFNDTRPEVYNAEAAADAWQRTVEFLRKHLSV